MTRVWIYVRVQIVGSADNWEHAYYWDGERYPTRSAAVRAGIAALGDDDFCIGGIDPIGHRLVWWGWQDREHPASDRESAAAGLGLVFG